MALLAVRWITLVLVAVAFLGCRPSSFSGITLGDDVPQAPASVMASLVSSATISGYDFQRLKLSSAPQRDSYIVYFPAPQTGTPTPRATVVITKAYDGFDWSQNATDIKWAGRPNATTGYAWDDEDSIGYVSAAGDQIPYSITSDMSLFGDAFYYLLHGMNVAFVFNRFYAGETFVEHAGDTSMALRYLAARPEVDAARIGVNGLSWGGMTASFGVVLSEVPVRSLVLQSPVLDVQGLSDHFTNWVPAHVTTPSQQTLFGNFFRPYGRRIATVLAGSNPPAVTPLLNGTSLAPRLASLTGHLLVLANEWDSLVPFASTKAVVDAFPGGKANGVWWTHATPLDYETAPADHNVGSSTIFYQSVVMTMTQLEMTQQLLDPSQPVTLLVYDQTEIWNYLTYVRSEQLRGVDQSSVLRMFLQMTSPQVSIMDQQNNLIYGPGALWVSNWLNGIWGTSLTDANVRAYLLANGLPP